MKFLMISTRYVAFIWGVCFSDFWHGVICAFAVDHATFHIDAMTRRSSPGAANVEISNSDICDAMLQAFVKRPGPHRALEVLDNCNAYTAHDTRIVACCLNVRLDSQCAKSRNAFTAETTNLDYRW